MPVSNLKKHPGHFSIKSQRNLAMLDLVIFTQRGMHEIYACTLLVSNQQFLFFRSLNCFYFIDHILDYNSLRI